MAITNANISPAFGSAATAVYTSSGTSCAVTLYLCNTGSTSVLCNLYIASSGITANVRNQVYANLNIASLDTYIVDTEKLIFNTGDFIAANANVGNVVMVTTSYTSI